MYKSQQKHLRPNLLYFSFQSPNFTKLSASPDWVGAYSAPAQVEWGRLWNKRTRKFKSTKPSLWQNWTPFTMSCSVQQKCWPNFKGVFLHFPEIPTTKQFRRQKALAAEEVTHHHQDAHQCDQEKDLLLPFIMRPARRLITRFGAYFSTCQYLFQ